MQSAISDDIFFLSYPVGHVTSMNPADLAALYTIPRRTAHRNDIALERSVTTVRVFEEARSTCMVAGLADRVDAVTCVDEVGVEVSD